MDGPPPVSDHITTILAHRNRLWLGGAGTVYDEGAILNSRFFAVSSPSNEEE